MGITFAPGKWGCILGGGTAWTVVLDMPNSRYISADGEKTDIPTLLLEKAIVKPGIIWADISFPFKNTPASLSGLTNHRAQELVDSVMVLTKALRDEEARIRDQALKEEFDRLQLHVRAVADAVTTMKSRERYIRGFDLQSLLIQEQANIKFLPRVTELFLLSLFNTEEHRTAYHQLQSTLSFVNPPYIGISGWNKEFVARERANPDWIEFFKNVESSPLSEEQEEAVVVHEDRNRLIAAAGSGKSSTLVAKVGYAVKKGCVEPGQVLALAFNKKAADEICERLERRLGIAIKAQTFHSLGKGIVESVYGEKRVVTDNQQVIKKIVTELSSGDPDFLANLLLFKAVHWESEPEREFSSVEEYEAYIKTKGKKKKDREEWGIPSLRGEPVRSYQELAIANWLFVHGVNYSYEPIYECDVTVYGWKKYEPDFMYKLTDGTRLYHEHFAIDANGKSHFGRTYEKSVDEKREMHSRYGTALIETTSAQFRDGTIFVNLKNVLDKYGVKFNKLSSDKLKNSLKERNDRDLIKLIASLIAHGKESGYDEEHFRAQAEKQRDVVRARIFLDILFPVWREYAKRLAALESMDFADMIGTAANIAENSDYFTPYKLILVDEFQDISPGRARLVKALLSRHPDSVLFGVGDDWQAINRFAGSDLSIMREFEGHFGKTETRRLSRTYRSNQGISTVAAKFVMQNNTQIKKDVSAKDKTIENTVRIVEYKSDKDLKNSIETKLNELCALAMARNKIITVLIIGRYQYDTSKFVLESDIDHWNAIYQARVEIKRNFDEKKNKHLPLDTVHKSKGLEADFVLVLGMQANYYAFPCEMEDDPLLGLSFANREPFEYAEERRLFYVALTRAREQVTLYLSAKNPSRFVLELLNSEYGDAVAFEGKSEKPELCTECKQGYLRLVPGKQGKYREFTSCTQYAITGCKGKPARNKL